MKSILSILAFLFLPAMLFGQSTDWHSGDGPYTISTEADLIGLRELVSGGNSFDGKIILLADDIALTIQEDYFPQTYDYWMPIGSSTFPFKGTLDGQGRTISNLTVSGLDYAGLFGYVGANGQIKNLNVVGEEIRASAAATNQNITRYAGGLAAYYASTKPIENCSVKVNFITVNGAGNSDGYGYGGGLVGYANAALTITNSYASGRVIAESSNGSRYGGGLVGYAGNALTITNSYANKDVIVRAASSNPGYGYGGGLVGYANAVLTITNSYASKYVDVTGGSGGNYGGGLVGRAVGLTITNSYASGKVTITGTTYGGFGYGGGFVGYAGGLTITNSYANGDVYVYAPGSSGYGGGFVGYASGNINTITSYRIGDVSASGQSYLSGYNGPIFGGMARNATSTTTYVYTSSVGGSNFKKQGTYIGFDFNEIWSIVEDVSYPYLKIYPSKITASISDDLEAESLLAQTYTGSQITPEPIVRLKSDSTVLTKDVDYTLTYGENKNVETAGTVTITGTGSYADSEGNISFYITPKTVTITEAAAQNKVYDGTTEAAIAGALYGVVEGDEVSIGEGRFVNKNVGTGKSVSNVALTGTSAANYFLAQPIGLTANISQKDLTVTGAQVTEKIYDGTTEAAITGAALLGVLEVDINNVSISNLIGTFATANAGTEIEVSTNMALSGTAAANYSLTQPVLTGTITAKSLATDAIQTIDSQTYTGSAIKPNITVKDNSTTLTNADYNISWENNTNAGTNTASVTVEGKRNYQGTATTNFTISPKNLPANAIQTIADETYTGSAITPNITVRDGSTTLAAVGYEIIAWENNTNAGKASVRATGIGNYAGAADATFVILPKNLLNSMLGAIAEQLYTGEAITPDIIVSDGTRTLIKDIDYEVYYSNYIHPGSASVSITGKGNYASEVNTSFEIVIPSSSSSDDAPSSSSSSDDAPSSSSSNDTPSSSSSSDIATPSSSSNGGTPIRSPQIAVSNQAAQIYNGINLQATNDAIIEVFNMQGNSINKQHFGNGVYTVPLGHLPKGLYIVKISFGSQKQILRLPVR